MAGDRKLSKRTKTAALMILAAIPLTMFIGIYYFDDRKYYFISALVLLEALIPFVMIFENRKPQARELIIIAVLCGIAVAGRMAFFWAPQFKPVTAIVMISAVAFGGEAGFLVGAMTALVSNLFFGQGPWTPWQMFAFGTIGFLTGILFRKGLLRSNKYALAILGGLATFFIYGGIMNPASVLMFQGYPTKEMFYLAYLQGIPFDLIHASATVLFLLLAAEPMLEKLERIKLKYGLIEAMNQEDIENIPMEGEHFEKKHRNYAP
jgi:energy-coupling factor transport system ATP-binding protein